MATLHDRSTRRLYWMLQFAGWGLYTAYVLSFTIQFEGLHVRPVVSVVGFLLVVSPLVCHGLRHWIRSHGWLTLPARRVLPRVGGVVLGVAGALTLLTVAFNLAFESRLRWHNWWPGPIVGIFWGYVLAFSAWLAIYFGVQRARQRRALEVRTLHLEMVAQQAQLRTLEAQLNPHFLFNCLNSVRALVVEDPPRAQEMITKLSDLLRFTLRGDDHDRIPLEDEVRAVRDYLTLEGIRFEERLSYRIDIVAARGLQVPRMLILTLVENAVKHGIGRLVRGGVIEVTGEVTRDHLVVDVTNTGTLQAAAGAGVGLRNMRERLQLLYGGAAALTLDCASADLVRARVLIPLAASVARVSA